MSRNLRFGLQPFMNRRWILTLPPMATGRSKMPCMPKIADCGGLMIGVPNMDPNTPPLLMVKVPPSMSSTASSFLRAYKQHHGSTRSTWVTLLLKLHLYKKEDIIRNITRNYNSCKISPFLRAC